jgi:hypothetical protein
LKLDDKGNTKRSLQKHNKRINFDTCFSRDGAVADSTSASLEMEL